MSITEINLIIAAKNNDPQAIKDLWEMYQNVIRDAHDFGRIGLKRRNRGGISKYACSFESVMADLYFVFLSAIRLYSFNMGATFKTFLTGKVNFFPLDYIRKMQKSDNTITFDELSKPIAKGDEWSESEFYNADAKTKVNHILNHYKKGCSKRKLLDATLACAKQHDEEMKTSHIAEKLNCTRANISAQMISIRKDLKSWGISLSSAA